MFVTIEDGTKEYWTTLRSLSSVAAEVSKPAASGFVSLDWPSVMPEEVEVRFDAISTTGTPDEVIYSVWRNLGGKVDKISTITILSADFAAPIPSIIRFDGASIWITASFTGGAVPTVTNLVQYRVIK